MCGKCNDVDRLTRENHGMNCAHRSDSDEPCTCACRHHAAVDTERTMHAAWRKRAEEAERENADLRARLEAAEKERDEQAEDEEMKVLAIDPSISCTAWAVVVRQKITQAAARLYRRAYGESSPPRHNQ